MTITIPTKKYIKDYLTHVANQKQQSPESKLLNVILTNSSKTAFEQDNVDTTVYDATIEVKISPRARLRAGYVLDARKVKQFNLIMAEMIRDLLFEKIKTFMNFDPCIKRAIIYSRSDLGIDDEHMSDEAISKFYQRNRAKKGLKSINKKKRVELCPITEPILEACEM